jgi:hypothetical protein
MERRHLAGMSCFIVASKMLAIRKIAAITA